MAEASGHRLAAVGGGNESLELEKTRYLKERVEKKEEQILKIEASVFQVANYNFVFQGVILAAIINNGGGGALKCHHFWLPLSLSAIGSVFNFGLLWMIAAKYREALDQLDERKQAQYNNVYQLDEGKQPTSLVNQHKRSKARRKCSLVLSMILFFIFAVLSPYAARIILCPSPSR